MEKIDILPERLRFFRLQNKMSRNEVCARLGVTPSAVSYWESGRRLPSADVLLSLCELYNVRSVAQLFGEQENPEELTESERDFLELFRKSDKEAKTAVIKLLRSW